MIAGACNEGSLALVRDSSANQVYARGNYTGSSSVESKTNNDIDIGGTRPTPECMIADHCDLQPRFASTVLIAPFFSSNSFNDRLSKLLKSSI